MGNAKFCYANLITEDATEITVSSGGEDPFYPVSNLKSPQAVQCYRSLGSTTAVIVFDFQADVTADTFLAVGNSLNGLDALSITIEANALDIWTSPAFTTTVTDIDVAANFASLFFTAQTYRYWRITVTGSIDYVEVSKWFLGSSLSLVSNNVAIGFEHGSTDISSTEKGRYGQRFIDVITEIKTFKGTIGLMTVAEQAQVAAVYDYCGTTRPLWFIPDPDQLIISNKDALSGYYYFTARPKFTNDFFGLYSTSFELEEGK